LLPPEMKTLHVSGEFGWIYLVSWTIMVSFGYNTSAMAQRCFSVDDEHSARKVALLCCGLFFAGAFLWFIRPWHASHLSRFACGMAVFGEPQ
jgi:Na+/proline symporter